MRNLSLAITFLTAAVVLSSTAGGADGPVQGPLVVEQSHKKAASDTGTNLRADVNMTLVPVTVLDRYGRNVTGLGSANFRIFDNKQPVPIASFSQQDQPVTVGLVYDCSSSMKSKFQTARLAPERLFKELAPGDESFLVTVSERADLRQPLTTDFGSIINALLFTKPKGTTSLVDGVMLALEQLRKAHNPRKALVVVSDGGENNSRYSLRELEERAVEANAQVFSIGLFGNPQTIEEAMGPQLLGGLTGKTGGIGFEVQGESDLREAMGRIGITLHNQYVLGFYPPAESPGGKFRKIKVELVIPKGAPKLSMFARSRYYLPEREAQLTGTR